jgi:hypothetical protein
MIVVLIASRAFGNFLVGTWPESALGTSGSYVDSNLGARWRVPHRANRFVIAALANHSRSITCLRRLLVPLPRLQTQVIGLWRSSKSRVIDVDILA